MGVHYLVEPLLIDRCQILCPQLAVQDCGDATVAIGQPGGHQRGDSRNQLNVLCLVVAPKQLRLALQLIDKVRAGYTKGFCQDRYREPPVSDNRACKVGFLSVTCIGPCRI